MTQDIKLKLIIFDFDGVFTNNRIYFNEDGSITKSCHTKDLSSLKLLQNNQIICAIISNDITSNNMLQNIKVDKSKKNKDPTRVNIPFIDTDSPWSKAVPVSVDEKTNTTSILNEDELKQVRSIVDMAISRKNKA